MQEGGMVRQKHTGREHGEAKHAGRERAEAKACRKGAW